jgi:hypothetical protein
MQTTLIRIAAFCLLLAQGASIGPLRTGNVAKQLTDQDVASLELVLGAKPWLLNGDQGQVPGTQYIQAYLPASITMATLRWGTVVTVTRVVLTTPQPWSLKSSQRYAQVAVAGRPFEQVEGDQDMNRPFAVIGSFEDAELIGLVTFLRSMPRAFPDGLGPGFPVPAEPILFVQRQTNNSVLVSLRQTSMRGQDVVLEKRGTDWIITSFSQNQA